MDDQKIQAAALAFAKKEGKRIAKELTAPSIFSPDEKPISVFMAGSPGAGKTEFSRNIILAVLEDSTQHNVIRIDSDDLRSRLPGYTGGNSYLFQGATSLIVEKIHDHALKQKQSFILDGTFSNYEKALENITRSLNKNRNVIIFYVYQDPRIAWEFTKERETAEGRNIPKEAFIKQFFGAKETVNQLNKKIGEKITIYVVKKDYKHNIEKVEKLQQKTQLIDDLTQNRYTKNDLKELI
jgi:UDP-N-acetylglucosamine kinase